jgi:competence protein ComEA
MNIKDFASGFLSLLLIVLGITYFNNQYSLINHPEPLRVVDNQYYSPHNDRILVLGAVKKPGYVVINQEPQRLMEVINLAGGLSDDANTEAINPAQDLEYAKIVYVPFTLQEQTTIIEVPHHKKKHKHKHKKKHKHKHKKGKHHKKIKKSDIVLKPHSININKASKDDLMLLPRIGDKMSDRIILYRSETPIMNEEDLLAIKGIGPKTLEKILPFITF